MLKESIEPVTGKSSCVFIVIEVVTAYVPAPWRYAIELAYICRMHNGQHIRTPPLRAHSKSLCVVASTFINFPSAVTASKASTESAAIPSSEDRGEWPPP